MQGDDIDLVDAAIACLKELAEPGAISIHEGGRDVFRIRVRCIEENFQI